MLRAKIMLTMGVSIVIVGGVLTFSNLRTLGKVINQAEKKELDSHVRSIFVSIASQGMAAISAELKELADQFKLAGKI